jgi:hypothetical protein
MDALSGLSIKVHVIDTGGTQRPLVCDLADLCHGIVLKDNVTSSDHCLAGGLVSHVMQARGDFCAFVKIERMLHGAS